MPPITPDSSELLAQVEGLTPTSISEPFFILTTSEVRTAEIAVSPSAVETADGVVRGRQNDVIVSAYGGERYPISASIFLGTYRVFSKVGAKIVARRLTQIRKAWEVRAPHLKFSYSDNRGVVPITEGSWIYQTDANDFGVINHKVKVKGHTILPGPPTLQPKWDAISKRYHLAAALLPAVLSLCALMALVLAEDHPVLADTLLITETMMLVAGIVVAVIAHQRKWALKAAVKEAIDLAVRFQPAASLLGEKPSKDFPMISLWRAAQINALEPAPFTGKARTFPSDQLSSLCDAIAHVLAGFDKKLAREQKRFQAVTIATFFAAISIGALNAYILTVDHMVFLEMFAIWIPAALASLHTLSRRSDYLASRAELHEFKEYLTFLQHRLFEWTKPTGASLVTAQPMQIEAVLASICQAVGEYTQRRISSEMVPHPEISI